MKQGSEVGLIGRYTRIIYTFLTEAYVDSGEHNGVSGWSVIYNQIT